jgi:hypothetical protein
MIIQIRKNVSEKKKTNTLAEFYLQHMICLQQFPSLFCTSASGQANKKVRKRKD